MSLAVGDRAVSQSQECVCHRGRTQQDVAKAHRPWPVGGKNSWITTDRRVVVAAEQSVLLNDVTVHRN